jgi:hypothetical protein
MLEGISDNCGPFRPSAFDTDGISAAYLPLEAFAENKILARQWLISALVAAANVDKTSASSDNVDTW